MKIIFFVGLVVFSLVGCKNSDPDHEEKSIAMQKCMDKIRDQYGADNVSFHASSAIELMNHNPESSTSIIDFDRKSAAGVEVTHRASCIDAAGDAPFMTMNPPIDD